MKNIVLACLVLGLFMLSSTQFTGTVEAATPHGGQPKNSVHGYTTLSAATTSGVLIAPQTERVVITDIAIAGWSTASAKLIVSVDILVGGSVVYSAAIPTVSASGTSTRAFAGNAWVSLASGIQVPVGSQVSANLSTIPAPQTGDEAKVMVSGYTY